MPLDMIVGLSLPVLFLLFMTTEAAIGGGRKFAQVRFWRVLGAVGLVATLAVNAMLPPLLLPWLPDWRPIDLSSIGLWGAAPVVAATTFLTYWTHRIEHRFDLLWRGMGHQLHHSVQRVDIASAVILHPIDVAVQVVMTAIAAWAVGATPDAAALGGGAGFAIALVQHWNIRTPRWLGWFIQRPEAHCLHHEREVHDRNFGDLPVWDMIFGTYANPAHADGVAVGFAEGRGRRVAAMLLCRDVHRDRRAAGMAAGRM
ncbi:sterol desaturase family protein [Sphingomonas sp. LB-2]|uniref:sterol desaturase family protein n=1 Tax=Sphingomonas caeni TaxID=2984949 RepID=UPI00222F06FD|nr:sterol desaturase family protein [Sphingomonas caeni]MCW3846439.1 sterol desaturase family protein [Sphingomonas caeni]